jgi:hypothetical protein
LYDNINSFQKSGSNFSSIAASRTPYKRYQACFPFGVGFRVPLSDRNWTIGFEYGMRITTTDYIDDASTTYFSPTLIAQKYGEVAALLSNRADPASDSFIKGSAVTGQQRGDPTHKDAYMFGLVTLTYRLKSGKSVLPKFR